MAGSSTVGSSTWTTNSVIRGHHIYKAIWTPIIGEQLFLKAEDRNEHDKHAVAVTNSEENAEIFFFLATSTAFNLNLTS